MDATNIDLDGLSLGPPAAERDGGLKNYFVESEAFRRVADRSKTVILGNRGSGKSAIFQMLAARARQEKNTHVVELAPEDYSYSLLTQAMEAEAAGSWAKVGAYAVAWKYLIYVLVMKAISERLPGSEKNRSLGKISRYIRDNHQSGQMGKLSMLVSYIKRLEGVKIGPYEAGLKVRELEKLYKLEEINHLIPDLKKVLEKKRVIVLVDELDRGWDASEDAQAFVAGLFQACVSINAVSSNLTAYMSLRQELYDNIPSLYEDAQKYRDMIEVISWDESSLQELIARRIQHALKLREYDYLSGWKRDFAVEGWGRRGRRRDTPVSELWGRVFQTTLDYRQSKSFNYMVDRTLYRPRELIQFCQHVVDLARGVHQPPFGYGALTAAEALHSEERTKDIAAEYRFQYPNLIKVFEVFRGKSYLFDRGDLELMCLEMIVGDTVKDRQVLDWLEYRDPARLIEILWQVGFLRARAVGGIRGRRRSGSSYLGSYQLSNLSLVNISQFQVHPMFRSYLGLKEPRR